MTPPPVRKQVTFVAVLTAIGAAIGTALALGPYRAPEDSVDRGSYSAGWAYVVERQRDGPGAASPWLRTDPGIRASCTDYSDGYAQLDGITDPAAFRAGCDDAAAQTSLQPPE